MNPLIAQDLYLIFPEHHIQRAGRPPRARPPRQSVRRRALHQHLPKRPADPPQQPHIPGKPAITLDPGDDPELRLAGGKRFHRRAQGRLVIVETVSTTSSAIADPQRAELGGPGYDRLLVVMPDKLAVFGDGEAIAGLAATYPGSWWGGDLPAAEFWGMPLSPADPGTARAVIERLK